MPGTEPFVVNGVKIEAVSQDITKLPVQVIVSSAGTGESMSAGVSLAVRRAGGRFEPVAAAGQGSPVSIVLAIPATADVVLYDLRKHSPLQLGSVAVTTAGLLEQVKYIFHAVIIDWGHKPGTPRVSEEHVRQATDKCFRLADTLGVRSIALPALGAGRSGGADPRVIVPAMVEAAFRCLERAEKPSLERVYFADIDPTKIDAFKESLLAAKDASPQVRAFAQKIGQDKHWPVPFTLAEKGSGGYDVTLRDKAGLSIELKRPDVASLNQAFIAALAEVRRRMRQAGEVTLSDADLKDLATDLREAGQWVFNEVFKLKTEIREQISACLETARSGGYLLSLAVQSPSVEDFPLIWEMLYDLQEVSPGPQNRYGLDRMWGFDFAIARQMVGTARSVFGPDISDLRSRGGMLLLAYDKLPNVPEVEVPGLLAQAKKHGLPCQRVDERLAGTAAPTPDAILDALAGDQGSYDFVHFACHASPASDASKSKLILSVNDKKVDLALRDLGRRAWSWENRHPLVFLNACESGEQPEFQTRSLVKLFLDRGARGVVATQCLMPDAFAAQFALHFYELFFGGMPIDRALLETRRYFLLEHNNPLGLAYSLYADPMTKVEWGDGA